MGLSISQHQAAARRLFVETTQLSVSEIQHFLAGGGYSKLQLHDNTPESICILTALGCSLSTLVTRLTSHTSVKAPDHVSLVAVSAEIETKEGGGPATGSLHHRSDPILHGLLPALPEGGEWTPASSGWSTTKTRYRQERRDKYWPSQRGRDNMMREWACCRGLCAFDTFDALSRIRAQLGWPRADGLQSAWEGPVRSETLTGGYKRLVGSWW